MNEQTGQPNPPELCEIIIRGQIDNRWSHWFEGLEITHLPNGNSLIRGPILDDAALYGILSKIRDLNLSIYSVQRFPQIKI